MADPARDTGQEDTYLSGTCPVALVARQNLTAAFNKVSRCAVLHAEAFIPSYIVY